jgi:hypothetical protein
MESESKIRCERREQSRLLVSVSQVMYRKTVVDIDLNHMVLNNDAHRPNAKQELHQPAGLKTLYLFQSPSSNLRWSSSALIGVVY